MTVDAKGEMKLHPLCKLFPEITGDEFKRLVDDIKSNGLREDIITLDGMILDGQNRFNGCKVAGVKPRFDTFIGDDPVAFVISKNLNRRHLSESQRAMIAASLSNCANLRITQTEAAKTLNVSRRSVTTASRIKGTYIQCYTSRQPELTGIARNKPETNGLANGGES